MALEEWIRAHGMTCDDAHRATHLSLTGGKYRVPHVLLGDFQRAYVEDAKRGVPLFLVERRSFPHFQPYIDIDIRVQADVAAKPSAFVQFATSACSIITKYVSSTSICLVSPPLEDKRDTVKWGVHIVFPAVVVDLTNMILLVLACRKSREWIDLITSVGADPTAAIDMEVYKNATLRMPFSDKPLVCPICPFDHSVRMDASRMINQRIADADTDVSPTSSLRIPFLSDEQNRALDRVLSTNCSLVRRVRERGLDALKAAMRDAAAESRSPDDSRDSCDMTIESEQVDWRTLFVQSASEALCVPSSVCMAALDGMSSSQWMQKASARALVHRQIDSHAHMCTRGYVQQMRPYRLGFCMDADGRVSKEQTLAASADPLRVLQWACIRNIDVTEVWTASSPDAADLAAAEHMSAQSFEMRDPSVPRMLIGGVNDGNSAVLVKHSNEYNRIVALIRSCINFTMFVPLWIRRKHSNGSFVVATDPTCPCARSCLNLKQRDHHQSRIYFEVHRGAVLQKCTCRKEDVDDRVTKKPCHKFSTKVYALDESDVKALFSDDAVFQVETDGSKSTAARKRKRVAESSAVK
jgi:hypothetical protein